MKKPLFLAIALCMVLAMGAPAQAAQSEMSTDGTYDIVVYTDGTTIIAKDSTGKVISSGTAGADDGKVVQAAVNAVGDGIVVLQAGTYALQSPIAIRVSNPAPAPTPTPTPGTPDLVVTEISWVPANPTPGDVITMKATIKNQGTGATPAGVIHGVAFTVDGNASSTVWSDNHVASIAPGGWVTVTANGGVAGATWTATAGTHTVRAHVDNVDRIKESNENNNVLTKTMTVRAAAPKPTPTPTATPTPTPTVPPNVEKPYKAHSIPGRINFADFDFGGEGIAYHDTEAGNQGGHSYRTDNADVDVGVRNGVSVPIVSHTYAGEWIRFSEVQVAESRTYAATFYASSTQDGRSFSVLVDGKKVATVEAPNTGDWHKFAPVTVQIPLTAGKHTVQITMDTGFADLAYVEFATVAPTPTPTATPTVTPTPTATATPKPTQTPSNNVYGAGANPTGNPIGGGDGYTNIVSRSSADFIVSTKSQLLSALQNARAGDIIYVEGNANIDMSGSLNVQIPAGVTLASNRGENGAPGGRIYQNRISNDQTSDWQPMFRTGGQNVRITGLRIEGPDKTTSSVSKTRIGILSTYRNLEVDNCEIWGWSGAGVNLYATAGSTMKAGGYVHHNNIHHCQMNGLGYGVLVSGGGTALIEANYLDYCRHAISGSGNANDGYEAQYNICGPNFIASYAFQFDMHGVASGSSTVAGDTIRIHHNTFTATGPVNAYPICIRGVPRNGAYIDHNWFYYTLDAPVWQTGGKTGISVTNNLIGSKGTLSTSGPIKFY